MEEYKEKVEALENEYNEYKNTIVEIKSERVRELVRLRRENPEQLITEIKENFHFEYVE